jgi:hypothetical protein
MPTSQAQLDFGNLVAGVPAVRTVTLENVSTRDLALEIGTTAPGDVRIYARRPGVGSHGQPAQPLPPSQPEAVDTGLLWTPVLPDSGPASGGALTGRVSASGSTEALRGMGTPPTPDLRRNAEPERAAAVRPVLTALTTDKREKLIESLEGRTAQQLASGGRPPLASVALALPTSASAVAALASSSAVTVASTIATVLAGEPYNEATGRGLAASGGAAVGAAAGSAGLSSGADAGAGAPRTRHTARLPRGEPTTTSVAFLDLATQGPVRWHRVGAAARLPPAVRPSPAIPSASVAAMAAASDAVGAGPDLPHALDAAAVALSTEDLDGAAPVDVGVRSPALPTRAVAASSVPRISARALTTALSSPRGEDTSGPSSAAVLASARGPGGADGPTPLVVAAHIADGAASVSAADTLDVLLQQTEERPLGSVFPRPELEEAFVRNHLAQRQALEQVRLPHTRPLGTVAACIPWPVSLSVSVCWL